MNLDSYDAIVYGGWACAGTISKLKEKEQEKVSVFYCPGGFNYEKMSTSSKLMMKMFLQMLKKKKDKTPADEEMIRMISSSYDISDKKYIEPIIECLG